MPSSLPLSARGSSGSVSHELKALAVVLREEFDTSFRFYNSATGDLAGAPEQLEHGPPAVPEERALALDLAAEQDPKVVILPERSYLIGFPLEGIGPSGLVALGVVNAVARSPAEMVQEQSRLGKWIRSVHDRLSAARRMRDLQRNQVERDRQSKIAWDAIMAIERLHRGLRTDKEPARNRRRILRIAGELLGVQSLAWVSKLEDGDVVLEGEQLLSPWDCGQLVDHLDDPNRQDQSQYVLVNEARQSRWGAQFPQIQNLLAVPVMEKTLMGWVLAFNKGQVADHGPNGREHVPAPAVEHGKSGQSPGLPFRRLDAAILMPFASLLGLQVRASQRYLYINDILVGLTRSLTAAIDAKDEYTYGHSERVARVAVELGRELGLREAELNDIYLAGLLHDIGKIGIRDDVLTKRGALTDDELKHIQQHPIIGHRILAGLNALARLLPGVLHHHERYDGRGYPDGLKGDSIPLLPRILAVADSFDAMNTSRPYRVAMPLDRVDQVLREGAGIQWDPVVIDAYFRCHDRVVAICQHGLGESLRDALDGALRNGPGKDDVAGIEMSIIN
jgi:HD-GYP domain-containing protein (c-di-GMP phosphodiesterase class II)